jgi:Ketosteroid isomerase homolog
VKGRCVAAGIVAGSCLIAGCSAKAGDPAPASNTAATAIPAASTDHSADSIVINRLDSAWMRYVVAKNVDSIMTEYSPDAVTYYSGVPTASGADQIRSAYSQMTKMAITDARVVSNTIKFSDDGTMAVDHGTSTMTASWPGGKKTTTLGSYMNVWKKSGDTWKIVADMSQPAPPASK